MVNIKLANSIDRINPILNIDSYKASHFLQFPSNSQYLNYYIESRGGQEKATLFFGLQAYIKQYLLNPITQQDIDLAEQIIIAHGLPFNRDGWQYILDQHQGYFPVEIYAASEGCLIPTHNVLLQIRNTDPNCYWLPGYLETGLLRSVWYPTTVATKSFKIKQLLAYYLEQSKDDFSISDLNFKLHDFGARSASSYESSELGGMAHLLSFRGTDTLSSLVAVNKYYNQHKEFIISGYSIPAAEHSTITSWGKPRELQAFINMFDQFAQPKQVFAIVCDSYDLFYAVEQYLAKDLKHRIETSGSSLVIRPDSGDPVEIVTTLCKKLLETFSYTVNKKGFKVFDHLRIIQGDGVNENSIKKICQSLLDNQISIENINFGMGTELLQNCNRDSQRFAMKASAVYYDGKWREISKQPVTDAIKNSKKGILKLQKDNNQGFITTKYIESTIPFVVDPHDLLNLVYRNGKLMYDYQWQDLLFRVDQQLTSKLLFD